MLQSIGARRVDADAGLSGLSLVVRQVPYLLGLALDAIAFFTLALQRGAVTTVSAITFVVEVVVPSIVGLSLFGDVIDPPLAFLTVAGLVLAIAGTVSLSRFAA